MKKRGTTVRRSGWREGVQPLLASHNGMSGPPRVPGVRIAYIGGPTAVVELIRAYWQARGAVFMHHSLGAGEHQSSLEEILERSDIVLHAPDGASSEYWRNLEVYCDRAEKPLILLEEHNLLALTDALATSLPLT